MVPRIYMTSRSDIPDLLSPPQSHRRPTEIALYPGHDVICRVPKQLFSIHSNAFFTMRYHTPWSTAESLRGVLGRPRPFAKRPPGSNSYRRAVLIYDLYGPGPSSLDPDVVARPGGGRKRWCAALCCSCWPSHTLRKVATVWRPSP